MIPGPPAFVRIATRRPVGRGWAAKPRARLNSCSTVFARTTPHCSNSDFTPASAPAREPVWDDAAAAPAPLRPDFTARIGLPCSFVIRRASWPKWRGLPRLSR
jgi:hypothetical protein